MGAPKTDSPKARYSRQFPTGNHLWVNTERMNRNLIPLCRSTTLDEMARDHAEEMALACELTRCLNTTSDIKENVLIGPSVQTAHNLAMCIEGEAKDNILNPNFKEFGMGAVKGRDNNVYICQLFC